MKGLALGFASCLLSAFLSASTVFGQAATTAPDEYGFVFGDPGTNGPTQTLSSFPLVSNITPNITAMATFEAWKGASSAWVSLPIPNGAGEPSSEIGFTGTLKYTVPDGTSLYRILIRWTQGDGEHTVIKYGNPGGLNVVGTQDEFNALRALEIGPAESIQFSPPVNSVVLLAGVAPRLDADYLIYQPQPGGGVSGQLVHAQKGTYTVVVGSLTCTHAVTLTFPLVGGPVFVGVKAGGMQLDQLLVTPYAQDFYPQCQ